MGETKAQVPVCMVFGRQGQEEGPKLIAAALVREPVGEEIRHLHEKIDRLLLRQWEGLVELQQAQLELMSDIMRRE